MKWILIITGILITFVFIIPCILITTFWSSLGTELSLSDFKSNEQLMEFVNGHLPIKLPDNAKVEKLQYSSWMDWEFKATIKLSAKEAKEYIRKVEIADLPELPEWFGTEDKLENEVKYFLDEYHAFGSLTIDASTGRIEIKCFTT